MSAILKFGPQKKFEFERVILPRFEFAKLAYLREQQVDGFSVNQTQDIATCATILTFEFKCIGVGKYFNDESRFFMVHLSEQYTLSDKDKIKKSEQRILEDVSAYKLKMTHNISEFFEDYLRPLTNHELNATLPMSTIEVLMFDEETYKNFDNF